MKIRSDFVTNSSSSSYTVWLGINLKNGEELSLYLNGYDDGGFNELYIDRDKMRADVLGALGNIEELISFIDKYVYWDLSDFDADWNIDIGWKLEDEQEIWDDKDEEEKDELEEYEYPASKKPISKLFLEVDPNELVEYGYRELYLELGKKV